MFYMIIILYKCLSTDFKSKLVNQMEICLNIDGQPFEKFKTMNLLPQQNITWLAISIVSNPKHVKYKLLTSNQWYIVPWFKV